MLQIVKRIFSKKKKKGKDFVKKERRKKEEEKEKFLIWLLPLISISYVYGKENDRHDDANTCSGRQYRVDRNIHGGMFNDVKGSILWRWLASPN